MKTLTENGEIVGFPGWRHLELIRDGQGPVTGMMAIHRETLELRFFPAKAVVCPPSGMGLTASLLYRQGVTLTNPEFFQFHPAFVSGAEIPFCLGDAVLESGGRFWAEKNGKPWYFLEEIYPDYGNRVPLLVINRTLHKIGQDLGQVYLDLTGIPPGSELKPLFTLIRRRFKTDPSKKSVPVEPRVSHFLGGLWADLSGQTSIPGLYMKLLDDQPRRGISGAAPSVLSASMIADQTRLWNSRIHQLFDAGGPENVFRLHLEMKECLVESMGVVRENKKLKKAEEKMGELAKRCGQISLADKGKKSNRELLLALNLPALVDTARAAVTSALLRNESRGEHYKPEFPEKNDLRFLKITKSTWAADGPRIEYEDVKSLF